MAEGLIHGPPDLLFRAAPVKKRSASIGASSFAPCEGWGKDSILVPSWGHSVRHPCCARMGHPRFGSPTAEAMGHPTSAPLRSRLGSIHASFEL